jgi:hypothetical protein
MKLLEIIREARDHLQENGRVSLRVLRRQFELDDEALDELIEELVDVQRVARREENVLVWSAPATPPTAVQASGSARPADRPVARSADARKVVTILFADLAGSTGLHERLDPESVNAFMENYYQAMRGAVEARRGTVVKFLGDGVTRNGDVVLGESTHRLVAALVTLAPLGSVALKGRAEAVKAYRVESLEMPPTIHALLAARIERLRPEERSVIERAAVVGRHFSRNAVAELLPRDVVDLDARLEALRRGELIQRDSGWFLGEPVLRFHHILIRDAAYRRLLKGTRAELHARFADWVAARAGDAADHDETIGWHLEQAHQLLRELGPLDAAGRMLGERAAQHLAAGRRALARDDLPVAANLLGRAVDRLDVDDAARADLALDWCEALLAAGDVGVAAKAIAELGRFIGGAARTPSPTHLSVEEGWGEGTSGGDAPVAPAPGSLTLPSPALNGRAGEDSMRLSAWHTCFTGQLTVLTAPQKLQAAADAVADAAAALAKLGDAAGEAKAHSVHAQALARLGKVGACEAALDQALAAARRAGDRRRSPT